MFQVLRDLEHARFNKSFIAIEPVGFGSRLSEATFRCVSRRPHE
jgi:hypothetical protein